MTTAHLDLAQAFLEGKEITHEELTALVKALKADDQFGTGRRVLDRAALMLERSPDQAQRRGEAIWIQQQRALCTYNDSGRTPYQALLEALKILEDIGLFDLERRTSKTLGLGGAIYKRDWELSGDVASLHSAESLYRAGWERKDDLDRSYCGVNAAFILDVLADQTERAARGVKGDTQAVQKIRQDATDIRRGVLIFSVQPPSEGNLWRLLTLAEAHFGLKEYAQAQEYLTRAMEIRPENWKAETCARQLIQIARSQGLYPSPDAEAGSEDRKAWEALASILDAEPDAAISLVRGRVGLALSGGGFRASYYHLGVLARLAEVDALRHVEAISTVSGGSIVGVLYYLEVKKLLETRSDLNISRDDYIRIVDDIQKRFFAAVSRNLRVRALASLTGNLKMMFLPGYSRSNRIGELYEDEIYASAGSGPHGRRTMSDLLIRPAGHDAGRQFKPNEENWRRRAKVPVLLINATSLNSGHNFQFTANWMGEPPGLAGADIDMNVRYRRVHYGEAPTKELRCFRLGDAVAASAGVPVLFEPLVLSGLYPGRTVRLVDGGVHDNQGVAGLLDEDCNFILCSDASGQMNDQPKPGSGMLETAARSSSISQSRVRETEYEDLVARERSGAVRGLMFVHLKLGLEADTISPTGVAMPGRPEPQPNQTPYGIDRDVQRRLAELRTDLDSFTEVEANALMLSGYQATAERLHHLDERHRRKGGKGTWGDLAIGAPREKWNFFQLEEIAAKPKDSSDLRRGDLETQLAAGKNLLFKPFLLLPGLKLAAIVGLVGALAALAWAFFEFRNRTLLNITLQDTLVMAGIFLAVTLGGPLVQTFLDRQGALRRILVKLLLPPAAWLLSNTYLLFINPRFLKRGTLARLLKLPVD